MAAIRERKSKAGTVRYLSQVRILGAKPSNRTFGTREEAERWGIAEEARLRRITVRAVEVPLNEPQRLHQAGVYILWLAEEVIYVGCSNHILQRVMQHHDNKKVAFDAFTTIACAGEEMLRLEKKLIQRYTPLGNIRSEPTHKQLAKLIAFGLANGLIA